MFFSERISLSRGFITLAMLGLVIAIVQFFFDEFVFLYAYIGALTVYVLYEDLKLNFLNFKVANLLALLMFTYVLQYALYRVGGRITASFLDPNISGYYLFLAYSVFRFGQYKILSIVALSFGVLSLSKIFI